MGNNFLILRRVLLSTYSLWLFFRLDLLGLFWLRRPWLLQTKNVRFKGISFLVFFIQVIDVNLFVAHGLILWVIRHIKDLRRQLLLLLLVRILFVTFIDNFGGSCLSCPISICSKSWFLNFRVVDRALSLLFLAKNVGGQILKFLLSAI